MSDLLLFNASNGMAVFNTSNGEAIATSNTSGCACCTTPSFSCNCNDSSGNYSNMAVTVSGVIACPLLLSGTTGISSASFNGSFTQAINTSNNSAFAPISCGVVHVLFHGPGQNTPGNNGYWTVVIGVTPSGLAHIKYGWSPTDTPYYDDLDASSFTFSPANCLASASGTGSPPTITGCTGSPTYGGSITVTLS